ncbi:unnamed protein product, partial [marine sediment metagenome]
MPIAHISSTHLQLLSSGLVGLERGRVEQVWWVERLWFASPLLSVVGLGLELVRVEVEVEGVVVLV